MPGEFYMISFFLIFDCVFVVFIITIAIIKTLQIKSSNPFIIKSKIYVCTNNVSKNIVIWDHLVCDCDNVCVFIK